MYKNSDRNGKHSPESIISRVISRFKMAKRGEKLNTNSSKQNDPNSRQDQREEEQKSDENRRISLHDLPIFCDQLENFIKHLRSIHHLQFITYDYPKILRNRFEASVLELEGMLKEISAALTNISKQKAQQSFVNKDITAVKKTLNRMRDDEFREMEKVVALYDKTLFIRWESVKITHKPEVLKTLLTDVKCKQLALENLDALVTRKLGHFKTFAPVIMKEHDKCDKEKSVIPLPLFSFCPGANERKSRIPLPPPVPPPPTLVSQNNTRKLEAQRLRRLRREEEDLGNLFSLATDLNDLPGIPLTFNNGPDNLIVNLNRNLPQQLAVTSTIASNNTRSQDELTVTLQEEMDTVLQALFGDLREEDGPIVVADNNRSDVSHSTMDKTIELHSVREPQS